MGKLVLASLLGILVLSGCGVSAGTDQTSSSEVQIQGKTPQDYYNQLLYKVTGTCGTINLLFNYLINRPDIELGTYDDGKESKAHIQIYLLADQTYVADYEERKVRYLILNGYGYDVMANKRISGKWSISADGLINLENLGVGQSLVYNGSPGVDFLFQTDLGRAGLKGQKIVVAMSRSTAGGVQTYNEYCGGN